MNRATANAIAALDLSGDVSEWWALMEEISLRVTNVDDFIAQLTTRGAELIASTSMEPFTRQLSAGGMDLIADLVNLKDQVDKVFAVTRRFPDLYWVTAEQAEACAVLWPNNWRQPLLDYLNASNGWQESADGDKIAWLDSLIAYWNNPTPTTTTQSTDRWAWVTPTQRSTLVKTLGDTWPELLGGQLDLTWPNGWESQYSAENLVLGLNNLLTAWATPTTTQQTVVEEKKDTDDDEAVNKKRKREEPKVHKPSNNWRTASRKAKEAYAELGGTINLGDNDLEGQLIVQKLAEDELLPQVILAFNAEFNENNQNRISMSDVATPPSKRRKYDAPNWSYSDSWAPGKIGDSTQNAEWHFGKHGQETVLFNYSSVDAYTRAALDFCEANRGNALPQGTKTVYHDFDPQQRDRECKLVVLDVNNKLLTFHALSSQTVLMKQRDGDIAAYLANNTDD
jgi:hypothetical protein